MFLNYDHSVFVEIEFEEHYGFLKAHLQVLENKIQKPWVEVRCIKRWIESFLTYN